jgi:hypothetical protein
MAGSDGECSEQFVIDSPSESLVSFVFYLYKTKSNHCLKDGQDMGGMINIGTAMRCVRAFKLLERQLHCSEMMITELTSCCM